MRKTVLLIFLYLFLFSPIVSAAEYILPYPSIMPGNRLYSLLQLKDAFMNFWYFGDMAKVKYNLALSDRYLIEAKTLFEYKQYKLATNSLKKSTEHYVLALLYENDVVVSDKDKGEQLLLLKAASQKHIEILDSLAKSNPKTLEWKEERKEPEELRINFLLSEAKAARKYEIN